MLKQNEVEEIIRLIDNGYDLELISFELDISIEQLQSYKQQLQLRRFAKESIKSGKTDIAIEQLNDFIGSNDNNIIEKMILLKLKAYVDCTHINEEDLQHIEEQRKRLGFLRNIDDILNELKVQIPKRKTSNLKRKDIESKYIEESLEENIYKPEEKDYNKVIKRYKEEISKNPNDVLNKKNILAFAYFKAGKIDEAKEELVSLIQQYSNYTAYRQLIHLEKTEGNFDDAKLWAYDCLEKYPDSIDIRQQLISIARIENDDQEIMLQLSQIINIDPDNKKGIKMIESINKKDER